MASARPVFHGLFMKSAKRAVSAALLFGAAITTFEYFYYMKPKYERYDKFYANLDANKMFKDICDHDKGYLSICPQELAKRYRDKGLEVPGDIVAEIEMPTSDDNKE